MNNTITIRSQAMLGTSHSWAVTIRSLLLELARMGHKLDLHSINGYKLFPEELEPFVENNYSSHDIDITYTLPRNFNQRFLSTSSARMAIYNYETSHLPIAWKGAHAYLDYVLPSSNFSKEVFVNAGWPEKKCIVVPHGIDLTEFKNKSTVTNINSTKKFRFLNVSIPHHRKNIATLVDAYYSEFTFNDDVVLILKTSLNKPKYKFECDVMKEIVGVQNMRKHRNKKLPQIEIIQHRYDSMVPLYNSCDCLVSASSSEGFGLPLLEALAAKMLVVAPRCTGQLDFLNDNNSLLVDVKEINAGFKYQYWRPTKGAKTFLPIVEDLSSKMRRAFDSKDSILNKFSKEMEDTTNRLTWNAAARMILEIP